MGDFSGKVGNIKEEDIVGPFWQNINFSIKLCTVIQGDMNDPKCTRFEDAGKKVRLTTMCESCAKCERLERSVD